MNHAPHSARELLVGSLGVDPYEALADLRRAGEEKARAAGTAYQLEQERKVVFALERNAIEERERAAGRSVTESKLDRLAYASERYREHLKGTAAAIEARELADSEYWSLRAEMTWDEKAIAHTNAMSRLDDGRGG